MSQSPPPKKRLAIFLDGTWNDVGDNTSVWRLRSLCAPIGSDQRDQLVYYDTGVGTQFGEKVRGGLYGYGIDEHVKKAYEWLVENYNDGDQIFIFGFSRGAFTARSLAGLISICGVLLPGTPLGVSQLYDRYRTIDRNKKSIRHLFDDQAKGTLSAPTREERWVLHYSRNVEIEMLGVWDTVAAIDLPGLPKHNFLDPNLRHDMKNAFHALAIDEHRHRFAPTLWTQSSPAASGAPHISRDFTAVEQRWFIGAHANLGGGYPSDLLPQIPLQWLAGKAAGLGLTFREEVNVEARAHLDPIADSYGSFFLGLYKRASKPYYRPIGSAPEERDGYLVATINETIDASVFERWRSDTNYRPQNLADWARRRGVAIEDLHGAVRADDPKAPLSRNVT